MPLNTARYEGTRQKADLTSVILQDVGLSQHHLGMLAAQQAAVAAEEQKKIIITKA